MPLDFALHTDILDNGLTVVIQPDHRVPVVAVNLWVRVGSGHERAGQTGLAHLFEHLMFQGSAQVASGEHFSALMAAGGRCNATTWFDRTNYYETVPTGALELALWLEADRHSSLLPALTQANLDNQRDVVIQEKRQRYDNQPYGNALADLYATVFPDEHPYQHATIGSMDDLAAASLDQVQAFYTAHYAPDNTVLTLVGDIEPGRGLELAQRYFGALQRRATPRPAASLPLDPLSAPARLTRTETVPNDRIYLGYRLPVDGTPQFLASSVALDCAAGLLSSPLEQRLVRGEQLATSISASALGLTDGVSLGLIAADVAAGVAAEYAEQRILEELAALAERGPTPSMMTSVRASAQRHWLSMLAASDERADQISGSQMLLGGADRINTFLDELSQVTAEQVQQAMTTWLPSAARACVTYLAGEQSCGPDAQDESEAAA